LGAQSITFTDHAPFPGDPFGNRMKYEELEGYVRSLEKLRNKYAGQIYVKIGLEIEYLPSYIEYYKELKDSGKFDVLMLGQHFYEIYPGKYSFSLCLLDAKKKEFEGCSRAIIDGINTGLFDVVAHPDRIFRRRLRWTEKMNVVSKTMIDAAKENGVLLEENESSKKRMCCYWKQFWELVPGGMIIRGLDAHSVKELKIM
jgi:histidinol-phosphatase (PHP family)